MIVPKHEYVVRLVFLHTFKSQEDINNEHNMDTVTLNDKRECLLWTLVRVDAISNFSWMKTRLRGICMSVPWVVLFLTRC